MVSTIISAASAIYGGIAASKQAEEENREIENRIAEERARNSNFYNKNYYSDATQLADNRKLLTEAANRLRRNNQAAAGTSAVMGGTNAQAAATKEANNQAYANAVSNVSANAQQYKQSAENTYLNRANSIDNQELGNIQRRREANINAIQSAQKDVADVASAGESIYNDLIYKYKSKNKVGKTEV